MGLPAEREPESVEAARRPWWRRTDDASMARTSLPTVVGEVDTWWICKPGTPRLSLRGAVLTYAALAVVVGATVWWVHARTESVWPYGRGTPSPAQQLLKYELVLAVFLVYATARSIPVWMRSLRLVRADEQAVPQLMDAGRWQAAARLLHRLCLLHGAVWRRPPARAAEWDAEIRPHLPGARRLYVYFRNKPPVQPDDPTSSFTPEVVGVGTASVWAIVALLPLIVMLYYLVNHVLQQRDWHRLISFNALLMIGLVAGYGTFYTLLLLGRVSYVRLAPGVAQSIRFSAFRRRPRIETLDLRAYDAALDTTSSRYTFCLVNRSDGKPVRRFHLPGNIEVSTACLRAVLSLAPVPPLADDQLEG